ncbi:hypothetical protein AALO_G00071090 [Alosa alosa]|uniref:Uncharacterized protein n=1 Tax=Alosa alosa TaxID=278164 RepID=A0AAV6H5J7_9TELE|nr:hypothetical protein AALO_G00071090 [Alosa alosa]
MATQLGGPRDCCLITTSGKCLVAKKEELFFRPARNVQKWKVYECKKVEAQGKNYLVFVWHRNSGSENGLLIVEGNEVKSSPTGAYFSMGLWNCQSAVLISLLPMLITFLWSSLLSLRLGSNQRTLPPRAVLSTNFTLSHTPHLSGRGGVLGLPISKKWKFTLH